MSADPALLLVASLLRRGRSLDRLSTALTALSFALGLFGALNVGRSLAFGLVMASVVFLGILQKFFALRVELDAELFDALARAPERLEENTRKLDDALTSLLAVPAENAGRSWTERSRGALRLLHRQALLCAAQWLVALGCLIAVTFGFGGG